MVYQEQYFHGTVSSYNFAKQKGEAPHLGCYPSSQQPSSEYENLHANTAECDVTKGDIMTSHQFSDNGIMMSYGAILPRS